MDYINWGMASMLSGLGLGYYLGERGWTGVKADMNNLKTDIEILKAKFSPAPVVVSAQTATPTV